MKATHSRAKLEHGLPCNERFFVIVLDLDVDDVDGAVHFAAPGKQVCEKTALPLASDADSLVTVSRPYSQGAHHRTRRRSTSPRT